MYMRTALMPIRAVLARTRTVPVLMRVDGRIRSAEAQHKGTSVVIRAVESRTQGIQPVFGMKPGSECRRVWNAEFRIWTEARMEIGTPRKECSPNDENSAAILS